MTQQAKMVAARRALAAAETAVGVVTEMGAGAVDRQVANRQVASQGMQAPGAEPHAADQDAGSHTAGQSHGHQTGAQGLAVPEPLAPLLPAGLRGGTIARVHGSTSVLLALAQAAAGSERWCALVGMPDVGWAAAASAGLDLNRVVAVPRPGPETATVLGALVDGFDVLLVGACPDLRPAGRRSLTGRLRQRGAVLLTDQPWPGAHLDLQVHSAAWTGVGHGHGLLTGQEMVVRRLGRGHLGGPAQEVRVIAGARGLSAVTGPAIDPVAGRPAVFASAGAEAGVGGPMIDPAAGPAALAEVG